MSFGPTSEWSVEINGIEFAIRYFADSPQGRTWLESIGDIEPELARSLPDRYIYDGIELTLVWAESHFRYVREKNS